MSCLRVLCQAYASPEDSFSILYTASLQHTTNSTMLNTDLLKNNVSVKKMLITLSNFLQFTSYLNLICHGCYTPPMRQISSDTRARFHSLNHQNLECDLGCLPERERGFIHLHAHQEGVLRELHGGDKVKRHLCLKAHLHPHTQEVCVHRHVAHDDQSTPTENAENSEFQKKLRFSSGAALNVFYFSKSYLSRQNFAI